MKNYKLSPSSLNLIKDCPKCFWLHHNKNIKRPDTIFPSLPSGMDRILKKHFDNFRDKNKLPPELKENPETKNMKLFQDKEKLEIWRDPKEGLIYKDENGNILMGAIDNVLVHNNKLVVLDYKTRGYPINENSHTYYQHQLDIYTFLLQKNGYTTEDFGFLLFYIPKKVLETGEIVFDTTLKKVKVNTEDAKKLFDKALRLLNGPCPIVDDEECVYCKLIESECLE